jgi:2-dehydropantoate 2-reductase
MKIIIFGAGGTGGALAGYLAKSGADVTIIARNKNLDALREKGLTVKRGFAADIHVQPIKACSMEEYPTADPPDVLFVCTKYYSLAAPIAFARRIASADTLIVPILNVFGTGKVMQDELPELTCLDGCIYVWAKAEEPGVIVEPERILRVFFGFRPGQSQRLKKKAKKLESILRQADIEGHFSEDIQRDALQKFALVSPMGAAGLYQHATTTELQQDGPARKLFIGLTQEVKALGTGMGIHFEEDIAAAALNVVDHSKPGLTTSMMRDVASGGKSEFSGLVDRVVLLGKEYHVPTPLYQEISDWGKEHHIQ